MNAATLHYLTFVEIHRYNGLYGTSRIGVQLCNYLNVKSIFDKNNIRQIYSFYGIIEPFKFFNHTMKRSDYENWRISEKNTSLV
jgi:hypothetical protein